MNKHRTWIKEQTKEQRDARERMALFPVGNGENGEGVEVLFVKADIWVVSPFTLPPSLPLPIFHLSPNHQTLTAT